MVTKINKRNKERVTQWETGKNVDFPNHNKVSVEVGKEKVTDCWWEWKLSV